MYAMSASDDDNDMLKDFQSVWVWNVECRHWICVIVLCIDLHISLLESRGTGQCGHLLLSLHEGNACLLIID